MSGGEWEVLIYYPDDAPEVEREAFLTAVADAVHDFEPRSGWDPVMIARLTAAPVDGSPDHGGSDA